MTENSLKLSNFSISGRTVSSYVYNFKYDMEVLCIF